MKASDVVAPGELLIGFTENGLSEQGNLPLEANPGGVPCNVLAMLRKPGRRTAFIGKVGRKAEAGSRRGRDRHAQPSHGSVGAHDAGLCQQKTKRRQGLCIYRNPGADMQLCAGEVQEELIASRSQKQQSI